MTDFFVRTCFFALYFFYLLFNCQVSIFALFFCERCFRQENSQRARPLSKAALVQILLNSLSFCESLSIISLSFSLVKRFFKTFLSFFKLFSKPIVISFHRYRFCATTLLFYHFWHSLSSVFLKKNSICKFVPLCIISHMCFCAILTMSLWISRSFELFVSLSWKKPCISSSRQEIHAGA